MSLAFVAQKLATRFALSDDDCRALRELPHRAASMDPGSYLVREGDKCEQCCALLSGFAFRTKTTGFGSRQILAIQLRGDLVDLQNSMLEVADHSVQTLTRAEVAFIPRRAIVDLAAQRPAIGLALWKDTLIDASIFREWILNMGQRDARRRIAHLFCELAIRQEASGIRVGPDYEWPMTQEQLGDAMGLTSVHVNRTLQRMRADGLIAIKKSHVTILDWVKLQIVGDFSRAYLHEPATSSA
jgi:CRP-like cAMP-binding protein